MEESVNMLFENTMYGFKTGLYTGFIFFFINWGASAVIKLIDRSA